LKDKISVFGEAGLEMSFDEIEVAVCAAGTCKRESDEETNNGMAVGGGIIFNVSERFQISLSGRMHDIEHSYNTFAAMFGLNF
jgi:opacity protein-like surface antigen